MSSFEKNEVHVTDAIHLEPDVAVRTVHNVALADAKLKAKPSLLTWNMFCVSLCETIQYFTD